MQQLFANNVSTTLSAALGATDQIVYVSSTAGFPAIGAYQYILVTIQSGNQIEILSVSSVNTTTSSLTVLARGLEGTSALAFPIGSLCEMRVTAGTLTSAMTEFQLGTSLDSQQPPYALNYGQYLLAGSTNPTGQQIFVRALSSTIWDIGGYVSLGSDTSATTPTSSTITTTLAGSLSPNLTGNRYIAQVTNGAYAGYLRSVVAVSSTTITLSSALPTVISGPFTVELYEAQSSHYFSSGSSSSFEYNGSNGANVVSVNASATLLSTQSGSDIVVTTGGAVTIALPAAALGLKYRIFGNSQTVTVTPSSGAQFRLPDGSITANSIILPANGQGQALILFCNGTNWDVQFIGTAVGAPAVQTNQYPTMGQLAASSPNLLFNGSGEFGAAGWSIAPNLAAGMSSVGDSSQFTFSNLGAAATLYNNSNVYPTASGIPLTVQAEMSASGLTSGSFQVALQFFSGSLSAPVAMTTQPALFGLTTSSDWTFLWKTITAPVGAIGFSVQFYLNNGVASSLGIRKIKVSAASAPQPYSREADWYWGVGGNSRMYNYVNTNTTCVSNQRYAFDSTASPITFTFPSNPNLYDYIEIVDTAGQVFVNAVTISSTQNIMGQAGPMSFNVPYWHVKFVYTQQKGWIIT